MALLVDTLIGKKNMKKLSEPKVAIVNFGMGNLFSVKHACEKVGLQVSITYSGKEILSSDAVILPGVGAFGDAMEVLRRLELVDILREAAESLRPFMGICLGMQMLMSKSYEFGQHGGLDIIKGEVLHFDKVLSSGDIRFKVPHVGWNKVYSLKENKNRKLWENSMFKGITDNEFMYFVHSYYAKPENRDVVLSFSRYGDFEFCSSIEKGNIFACQFHPERSGQEGLKIYENFKAKIVDN